MESNISQDALGSDDDDGGENFEGKEKTNIKKSNEKSTDEENGNCKICKFGDSLYYFHNNFDDFLKFLPFLF